MSRNEVIMADNIIMSWLEKNHPIAVHRAKELCSKWLNIEHEGFMNLNAIVGVAIMLLVIASIFTIAPNLLDRMSRSNAVTDKLSPFSPENMHAAGVDAASVWAHIDEC